MPKNQKSLLVQFKEKMGLHKRDMYYSVDQILPNQYLVRLGNQSKEFHEQIVLDPRYNAVAIRGSILVPPTGHDPIDYAARMLGEAADFAKTPEEFSSHIQQISERGLGGMVYQPTVFGSSGGYAGGQALPYNIEMMRRFRQMPGDVNVSPFTQTGDTLARHAISNFDDPLYLKSHLRGDSSLDFTVRGPEFDPMDRGPRYVQGASALLSRVLGHGVRGDQFVLSDTGKGLDRLRNAINIDPARSFVLPTGQKRVLRPASGEVAEDIIMRAAIAPHAITSPGQIDISESFARDNPLRRIKAFHESMSMGELRNIKIFSGQDWREGDRFSPYSYSGTAVNMQYGGAQRVRHISTTVNLPFTPEAAEMLETLAPNAMSGLSKMQRQILMQGPKDPSLYYRNIGGINDLIRGSGYFFGGGVNNNQARLHTFAEMEQALSYGVKAGGDTFLKGEFSPVTRFAFDNETNERLASAGVQGIIGGSEVIKGGEFYTASLVQTLSRFDAGRTLMRKYGIRAKKDGSVVWNPTGKPDDPFNRLTQDILGSQSGLDVLEKIDPNLVVRNARFQERIDLATYNAIKDLPQYSFAPHGKNQWTVSGIADMPVLDVPFQPVMTVPDSGRRARMNMADLARMVRTAPKSALSSILRDSDAARQIARSTMRSAADLPDGNFVTISDMPAVHERALEIMRSDNPGDERTEPTHRAMLSAMLEKFGDSDIMLKSASGSRARLPSVPAMLHMSAANAIGEESSSAVNLAFKLMASASNPSRFDAVKSQFMESMSKQVMGPTIRRALAIGEIDNSHTAIAYQSGAIPPWTMASSRLRGDATSPIMTQRWPATEEAQTATVLEGVSVSELNRRYGTRFSSAKDLLPGNVAINPLITSMQLRDLDVDGDTQMVALLNQNAMGDVNRSYAYHLGMALQASGKTASEVAKRLSSGDLSGAWQEMTNIKLGTGKFAVDSKVADWFGGLGGSLANNVSKYFGIGGRRGLANRADALASSFNAYALQPQIGLFDNSVEVINTVMDKMRSGTPEQRAAISAHLGTIKKQSIDLGGSVDADSTRKYFGGLTPFAYTAHDAKERFTSNTLMATKGASWLANVHAAGLPAEDFLPLIGMDASAGAEYFSGLRRSGKDVAGLNELARGLGISEEQFTSQFSGSPLANIMRAEGFRRSESRDLSKEARLRLNAAKKSYPEAYEMYQHVRGRTALHSGKISAETPAEVLSVIQGVHSGLYPPSFAELIMTQGNLSIPQGEDIDFMSPPAASGSGGGRSGGPPVAPPPSPPGDSDDGDDPLKKIRGEPPLPMSERVRRFEERTGKSLAPDLSAIAARSDMGVPGLRLGSSGRFRVNDHGVQYNFDAVKIPGEAGKPTVAQIMQQAEKLMPAVDNLTMAYVKATKAFKDGTVHVEQFNKVISKIGREAGRLLGKGGIANPYDWALDPEIHKNDISRLHDIRGRVGNIQSLSEQESMLSGASVAHLMASGAGGRGGGGRGGGFGVGGGGGPFGRMTDSLGGLAGLGWLGWTAFSAQRISSIMFGGIREDIADYRSSAMGTEALRGAAYGHPDIGDPTPYQRTLQRDYALSKARSYAGEQFEGWYQAISNQVFSRVSPETLGRLEATTETGKGILGSLALPAVGGVAAYRIARDMGWRGLSNVLGPGTMSSAFIGGAAKIMGIGGTLALSVADLSSAREGDPDAGKGIIGSVSRGILRSPLGYLYDAESAIAGLFGKDRPNREEMIQRLGGRTFDGFLSVSNRREETISQIQSRYRSMWDNGTPMRLQPGIEGLRELADMVGYGLGSGGSEASVKQALAQYIATTGVDHTSIGSSRDPRLQAFARIFNRVSGEGLDFNTFMNQSIAYAGVAGYGPSSMEGMSLMSQFASQSGAHAQSVMRGAPYTNQLIRRYGIMPDQRIGVSSAIDQIMSGVTSRGYSMGMGVSSDIMQNAISMLSPSNEYEFNLALRMGSPGVAGMAETMDLSTGLPSNTQALRSLNLQAMGVRASQQAWQFGFQQRESARNFGYQRDMFGIDARRAQMSFDYSMSSAQRSMSHAQESFGMRMAERGLSRQLMMLGFRQQGEEMDIGRDRQLVQREWQNTDFLYGRQLAGIQFEWRQDDMSRNIRLATGRQKRGMIRQRERDQILYGMQEDHAQEQFGRREEVRQWEDEDHKRRKEYFEERKALQTELFDMQTSNMRKAHDMQMENISARIEQLKDEKGIQDEVLEIREKKIDEDEKAWQEQFNRSVGYWKKMFEIERTRFQVTVAQENAIGKMRIWMTEIDSTLLPSIEAQMKRIYTAAGLGDFSMGDQSPVQPAMPAMPQFMDNWVNQVIEQNDNR